MWRFHVLCSSWVMCTRSLWVMTRLWRLRIVWSPAFKSLNNTFWSEVALTLIQPTLKSLSLVTEQESTASLPTTTVTFSTEPRNSGSKSSPRLPYIIYRSKNIHFIISWLNYFPLLFRRDTDWKESDKKTLIFVKELLFYTDLNPVYLRIQ